MRLTVPMLIAPLFVVGCGDPVDTGQDTGRPVPRDTGVNGDAGTGVDTGNPQDAGPNDTGVQPDTGVPEDAGNPGCTYPAGPATMMLNQTMPAYSWPEADDLAGGNFPLSLEQIFCNTDPNRDWSGFDMILFVSWPEW